MRAYWWCSIFDCFQTAGIVQVVCSNSIAVTCRLHFCCVLILGELSVAVIFDWRQICAWGERDTPNSPAGTQNLLAPCQLICQSLSWYSSYLRVVFCRNFAYLCDCSLLLPRRLSKELLYFIHIIHSAKYNR